MSSGLYVWSQTAASNATADSTINWAEGQAPSTVNDSARAMMAGIAKYRDDIAGGIVTGGTSTAYTVTSNQVFDTLAHLHNQMIAFVPNATNTNAVGVDVTLNVDGLGAKPIRIQPSVALPNGSLVLGTPYIVTYNNSDAVFYLQNMVNPYVIPLGAGMPFFGTAAPNSSFAFPAGQQISQTTYSTLYAIFGVNRYGTDAGGNFFLPDLRGKAVFSKDNMGDSAASILTTAGGGVDGSTLGASGGNQSVTLITGNLPAYTPAGTIGSVSITVNTKTSNYNIAGGGSAPVADTTGNNGTTTGVATATGSAAFTGTAQGGTSTPIKPVPPAFVANFIIRII
jgi:microcystin-dependent protein